MNVSPQGLNIAPALIAVTPGRVAVNPQGGTISPVGLSLTAPAEPAKRSLGRRMLQQTFFEDLTDAVTSLAAGAEAAANSLLGGAPAPVATPAIAPTAASAAQAATTKARPDLRFSGCAFSPAIPAASTYYSSKVPCACIGSSLLLHTLATRRQRRSGKALVGLPAQVIRHGVHVAPEQGSEWSCAGKHSDIHIHCVWQAVHDWCICLPVRAVTAAVRHE